MNWFRKSPLAGCSLQLHLSIFSHQMAFMQVQQLKDNKMIDSRIDYIHENPVTAGWKNLKIIFTVVQ